MQIIGHRPTVWGKFKRVTVTRPDSFDLESQVVAITRDRILLEIFQDGQRRWFKIADVVEDAVGAGSVPLSLAV